MKSTRKTSHSPSLYVVMCLVCLCAWWLGLSACPTPQPTQEPKAEASQEKSGQIEKVETDASDTDKAPKDDATPEPTPEPVAKLKWSKETWSSSVVAGVDHALKWPNIEGGKGKITYKIEGAVTGVSISTEVGKEGLLTRLPYDQKEPLKFALVATDEAAQTATLQVSLTSLSPVWTQIKVTGGPGPRANPSMGIAGNKLLVLGGFISGNNGTDELWIMNRTTQTWTKANPKGDIPPKAGVFRWEVTKVEKDGEEVEGVVLQGNIGTSQAFDATYHFRLIGTDVTWTKLENTNAPKDLLIGTSGYDPESKTLLFFGGVNTGTSFISDSLFTIEIDLANGKAIWKRSTIKGPPGRYGAQFGMDKVNGRFYVASGTGNGGALKDLWVLHLREKGGLRWQEIKPKGTFLGRQNGALFVDSTHHRVFIWGGSAGGVAPVAVSVVNLKDKEPKWEEIDIPQTLDGRTSTCNAVDAKSGENFMGYGRNPGFLNDVWSFQPNPAPTIP